MAWDFVTMVVQAELAPLARALASGLTHAGVGMFTTPLSPTGSEPATHYISSGAIEPQFTEAIATAEGLFAACQAVGAPVTLEQCRALVDGSDVSMEPPFDVLDRMGLSIVQPGEA